MTQSSASLRRVLAPTERLVAHSLYLRPPAPSDMAFVRWLWADEETMRPVGGPILLSDDEAERWYARVVDPGRGADCYCLIRLLDDSPVGEISFHRLEPQRMAADLNLKVMASARGRGFGREAGHRFLDYYFNSFGGRLLADNLAPGNALGQAAIAGLGFRQVLGPSDVVRFELTAGEFRQLSGQSGEGKVRKPHNNRLHPAAGANRARSDSRELGARRG
jgi:RimJ/RimL family protein N-acetyltransferase